MRVEISLFIVYQPLAGLCRRASLQCVCAIITLNDYLSAGCAVFVAAGQVLALQASRAKTVSSSFQCAILMCQRPRGIFVGIECRRRCALSALALWFNCDTCVTSNGIVAPMSPLQTSNGQQQQQSDDNSRRRTEESLQPAANNQRVLQASCVGLIEFQYFSLFK